jgi:type II secretory ATPase GspE/PulE/Tfp pilus assembly ATPase PilB-like protein
LSRRLCPYCKKEVDQVYKEKIIEDAKKELADLSEERLKIEIPDLKSINDINNLKLYEPVGCPRCQNTGYLERVVIAEAIKIDEKIKDAIINDLREVTVEKVKSTQEFVSIKQDGYIKVLNGITNIEEILRVVES